MQIVNLSQASLNGCGGEIVDYVERSKRWTIQVRVNNNETTLNIKAENLIVVKTETKKTTSTCRDFDIGQWTPGHGRCGGAIHGKHEKEAVCNADQPFLFDSSACPTYLVFVTFGHGVRLSFGVHSGTTVGGLKYWVYLQTALLERKIQLMSAADHAGNVIALGTEATLYDCGFGTESSTIRAVLYNEVTVKMVTGKTYTLLVVPDTTLQELKSLVQKILCLPTSGLQFVLVNKIQRTLLYLNNEVTTLAESGVQDGTTLQLILLLRGGGPGRGTAMFWVQQSLTQCNADGRENAMDDCASTTTKCGPNASEFGFDAPVACETACVLGNATLKEITTMERLSRQVGATELSALPWSVAGVVIECDDAGGNAHAQAFTAPECDLGASAVGLDSAVVSKISSDSGRLRFGKVLQHLLVRLLHERFRRRQLVWMPW